jgi:hypothetical protein
MKTVVPFTSVRLALPPTWPGEADVDFLVCLWHDEGGTRTDHHNHGGRKRIPIRVDASIERSVFPSEMVDPEVFKKHDGKALPGLTAPIPLLRCGK